MYQISRLAGQIVLFCAALLSYGKWDFTMVSETGTVIDILPGAMGNVGNLYSNCRPQARDTLGALVLGNFFVEGSGEVSEGIS